MKSKHTKNSKFLNKFLLIVRVILILIIIYCSVYIIRWYIENKKNSELLSQITNSSILDTIVVQLPSDDNSENQEEIRMHQIDFNTLLAINDSTVGWLTVPNTSIDYPVVKASDNSFYLNHTFDKSKNSAGWVFADYRNKFDGTDKNIIVYGHNRMDSSMFATLKDTQNSDWYTNPNNRYITFSTPSANYVYEVFSVYTIKAEDYYLTTYFQNDNAYLNFLTTLKSRSLYDFNVSLEETSQILTLSTCDSTGKSRVVVHAKKVV